MPLVSKSEAARLVGVTRQTIHRKVKAGELSATGGEIDTSELIRVFGAISDGTQPVTGTSQPDSAVQTTLQARVDGLESQLAVTREQLADTSKDRDEWREIAKEATSNVKLITNQAAAPKNNDNIAIFIAGAFALGLLTTAIYFMVLRNDVTPSDVTVTPKNTPSPLVSYYLGRNDQIRVQEGLEPIGRPTKDTGVLVEPDPEEETSLEQLSEDAGIDFSNLVAVPVEETEQGADVTDSVTPELQDAGIDFSNLVAVPVEETEQGADVTDSVTPELQADTAGLVTDPELLKRLRYLHAKKLKTIWTIGMNERPEGTISLEQLAEDNRIDLGLLQSIDITDKDIADYWDSFDP
jgi:hypothetical protein